MPHPVREAVKNQFYPYVEAKGFLRLKSRNSLFTTFRMKNGDTVYEFEIQWDKRSRPYFVLNFSLPEGAESTTRTKHGRLQRKRGGGLGCWFNLKKSWPEILRTGRLRYKPEEVVNQLIRYFPEIETWWSTGVEGPHVYCV